MATFEPPFSSLLIYLYFCTYIFRCKPERFETVMSRLERVALLPKVVNKGIYLVSMRCTVLYFYVELIWQREMWKG